MSTTPSTSEIPYTIVGGTRVQKSGTVTRHLSLVVLDRGSRTLRPENLERALENGVDEVIAVVGPAPHYDVEQMASRISDCRFLLLSHALTAGEQVNVGIHEASSSLVAVLWSDEELQRIPERVLRRIADSKVVCTVPGFRNDRGVNVPSIMAPAFHGRLFRTIPVQPGRHIDATLYPFDFVGIYRREAFKSLGGYDARIANPYWQRLDFGMRCYLWGERIAVAPEIRVEARRPLPEDDASADASYARFHLKNLAVRFSGDSGRLPFRRLFSFIARSGLGPAVAIREFNDVRAWIRRNTYRFVQDARRVTELWEVEA